MSNSESFICIGLMSGTSLDGADAVAADFSTPVPTFRGRSHVAFSSDEKELLLSLCSAGPDEIDKSGRAAATISERYAEAVNQLLAVSRIPKEEIRGLGAHGQTVRHRPSSGFSVQLINPSLLAELTGIDVVADFRNADLAAGGQGAPLVPAFHEKIFRNNTFRVIVNIGGIANLSLLPPEGSGAQVSGFDCGPGNMLMDAWCSLRTGRPFDEDGAWAASGLCQQDLFDSMFSDPYFATEPPKSTGRELFNIEWLKKHIAACGNRLMRARDIQATLLKLTARGISDAVARYAPEASEIYLCGGGALNPLLTEEIARMLPSKRVASTAALGVHPMDVEGLAFAWLAYAYLNRIPGNCPAVTGARKRKILGALYPAS